MIFAIGLVVTLLSVLIVMLTMPNVRDWLDETPKFFVNCAARWGIVIGLALMTASLGMLAWSYLP